MTTRRSPEPRSGADRRLVLWTAGAICLLSLLVGLLAPTANSDPRPSTYNTAPGGAKAAFLLLRRLGWSANRWGRPMAALAQEDASETTLVLADPQYTALQSEALRAGVKDFLRRGGRVLATGPTGASLLPGGSVQGSRHLGQLCFTTPEGPGALARAGEVSMDDTARWGEERPGIVAEQRCGPDAVVVRFAVGAGTAVWWSSPGPLTNSGLHNDAGLKLFLASLGDHRRVLFDESLQEPVPAAWSALQGLPLRWALAQLALLFLLTVFSFSRRRGPVRLPQALPRSSPVEFAESMGDLYARAGATEAATEAAQRQLEHALRRIAGLRSKDIEAGPEAIAQTLSRRLGGDWETLATHLHQAEEAATAKLRPVSALRLVQALGTDRKRLEAAVRKPSQRTIQNTGNARDVRQETQST